MNLEFLRTKLRAAGVTFAPGLTTAEVKRVEDHHGFMFPPDLNNFLKFALPISDGWPDWRDVTNAEIERMMSWPYDSISFDIENNAFWLDDWGTKPLSNDEACAVAKQKITEAPKLIPICGHRYIPDAPNLEGNPVFSVYQTDIIYYGADLLNYLENEFHYYFQTPEYCLKQPIREIDLWSRLVAENC